VQFTASEEKAGTTRADVLRSLEKQFDWQADDWHFTLLLALEPHEVYAWFRDAKLHADRMFFNGATRRGTAAYDWVKQKYDGHVFSALGGITLCLSKDRQIVKSHDVTPFRAIRKSEGGTKP